VDNPVVGNRRFWVADVQRRRGAGAWAEFQRTLRAEVNPATWQTWFSRLRVEERGEGLTIIAPSDFHLHWILDKHQAALKSAFESVYGAGAVVRFDSARDDSDLADDEDENPVPADPDKGHQGELPMKPAQLARLVNRYRFESFVVGQSNRFAHAAAMAVGETPGTRYNPLFIYGGAGLGKTHLLHAIGNLALELYPDLSVRYVSSETFLNEFVDSIRKKRMDDFKQRYRTTDILLLDDVQFFEGREQMLEEFFHTFNSLYEAGKQLVISSDRAPRHLSTLEDRLRSRFEWGLITDIQPPDVETRLAILKRNAEFSPTLVPPDVLHHIASLISDNIRELEGALTRVTAFASLTEQPVDLDLAEKVLHDRLPGQSSRAVDGPRILDETASEFGCSLEELRGPSRRQPLVLSRQIAMYLCRELTDLSLPRIGDLFGGRDHTTVLHGVAKVRSVMKTDRDVYDKVTELSRRLRTT
jgi:chromosomal replication initiator protein